MTVQDVLKLTVQYIGDEDLLKTTSLGGTQTPTEQQNSKLNMLLTCANDTIQSLALMYFPLKFEEDIYSQNGIFEFSSLQKPVLDILSLTDSHLKTDVKYSQYPTYFETKSGYLHIIYTYSPANLCDFLDKIEVVENKVTQRLVALGIVSRYYMLVGMYSDASSWNETFERAILVAKRRKDNVVLKKRRWI